MRAIGVDVGGTFTDLISVDEATGAIRVAKVSSTPSDQSIGFINAMLAGRSPADGSNAIIHGSTVATNALLERKGALAGLIATKGFRDILELRRRDRPKLYGLGGDFQPLIPRPMRFEVDERVNCRGDVLVSLAEDQVLAAAKALKAMGAEVVVISFMHSYANTAHEERARALLAQFWPPECIVTSSGILPEFYEFERTSTAVVNAYVQPKMHRYLTHLRDRVREQGYAPDVSVVRSNGGMMSSELAGRQAIHTVNSGPAAGVIAAVQIGTAAGFRDLITGDMGGTSFDICLAPGGKPAMRSLTQLEFGIPIKIPMTDISAIGAGGGSIAWIDRGGILRVGPQSAGADPGPACYGIGGSRPTVTDANLVLGRINARRPIGSRGSINFDVTRAQVAIREGVADPLGLSVEAAAKAIVDVVNNNMAGAMRVVSVARGYDPRDFTMVAFGGAGPLHAGALMRLLGLARVLVPFYPGITSALGCVLADVRLDHARTINRLMTELPRDALATIFAEQKTDGLRSLAEQGLAYERIATVHRADMVYEGQTHTVLVDMPEDLNAGAIQQSFEREYRRLYGRLLTHQPLRLVSLRTTVTGLRPKPDLRLLRPAAAPKAAPPTRRQVYFAGGYVDCAVYERSMLEPGSGVAGPAIIEQDDSTVVVEPGMSGLVDDFGNLILEG